MALTTGLGSLGTQFASAMKTFYLGPLNKQTFMETPILNRLQKNSDDVAGNYAYIPLITARNPGVGSRVDTSGTGPTIPPAGAQSYQALTFRMAYHYGRGSISGPVMRNSRSNAGAFSRALDVEMQGLNERLPKDLNRQLWSYGHGRAATLASTQTSTKTMEFSSQAIFSCKVDDRVHFADITAGPSTRVKPTNGTTVAAINRDTDAAGSASTTKHQVILAALSGLSLTYTADAMYFGAKTSMGAPDSSWGQEMFGIPAMIDDGSLAADEGLGATTVAGEAGEFISNSLNFGGLARSSNVTLKSTVLQNPSSAGTNRTLTVALMERMFLSCLANGAKASDLDYYSSAGLWATFGLLHIGDRIFNDFKETLQGGFIALKFNERPYFYDSDAPRDRIWFIDMSTVVFLTQGGYEMMDEDGSVLSRVANTDAYEFTLYRDCQLGANKCRTSGILDDCISIYNVEVDIG